MYCKSDYQRKNRIKTSIAAYQGKLSVPFNRICNFREHDEGILEPVAIPFFLCLVEWYGTDDERLLLK
nr:hypothetical protein CFP56_40152 [Quercus suber]